MDTDSTGVGASTARTGDPDAATKPTTIALLLIAAVAIRVLVFPLHTTDVTVFLIPWVSHADRVGIGYLHHAFTNYTPFYEHCLAFIALFPGPPDMRGKLFSIAVELIMAGVIAALTPRSHRALAFCATLLLPSVIYNSAIGGQCDVIYTTFLMLALLAAVHRRPVWTMLAFAAALAIKLQAIMFAPVLALLFLERRQPLWTIVLLPVPYIVFALPMWLAGRGLSEILFVYGGQFGSMEDLAAGAPNVWILAKFFIDYHTGITIGLPLAVIITGATLLWIWRAGLARSQEGLLLAAALFLLVMPFVTPKMLDHFFYPAQPVLAALVFHRRSYWIPLILSQIANVLTAYSFLMMVYGQDNALLGGNGYLQQHFHFGWGILCAVAAVPMGLAIVLLVREARRLAGDPRERPSLAALVRARLGRAAA